MEACCVEHICTAFVEEEYQEDPGARNDVEEEVKDQVRRPEHAHMNAAVKIIWVFLQSSTRTSSFANAHP